jgi:DNA repair exonuclease SbcCD ATPase subunit
MVHKITAGIMIFISSVMLSLSISGVILIWTYKEPLIQTSDAQLQIVENELEQAQTALQNAELELQRTLRTVDAAEKSMAALSAEFVQVKAMFGDVNSTLESQLLPGLKTSREKIDEARLSLLNLQASIEKLKSMPLMSLNLPGDTLLANLIASAGSLDTQIAQLEELVKKASTFMGDASYMLGGDFTETRDNLQNFLSVVQQYDLKFKIWREQLAEIRGSLPGWINNTSLGLTIFLAWVGLSQGSLILHGLSLWRGPNPLARARPKLNQEEKA